MIDQLIKSNDIQPMQHKKNNCTVGKISKNIIAVLPAYNEEDSIGSIILLTKLYTDKVIVVDNASSDLTAKIAKKTGAEVLVHQTNTGKGSALETGFKTAVSLGADIIVTMNSNGHHNPADIPKLVAPIIKGTADIVNGSLYLNSPDRTTLVYRRVGQTILSKFTKKDPRKITNSQTIFRACAASIKGIVHFDSQGMVLESETLVNTGKVGLRIKEVEIGTHRRFGAQVKNPATYIFEVMKTVARDIEINSPLYIYAVPGFALATCGFYMGVRFLEGIITFGIESLHFWPVFLMIFLSLVGVYMTMRGIVKYSLVDVAKEIDYI